MYLINAVFFVIIDKTAVNKMTEMMVAYLREDRNFEINNFKTIIMCDFPRLDHDCFPFYIFPCYICLFHI
jgi:hypothetical protein